MSEDPMETEIRIRRAMTFYGYQPTDRETEFLLLMDNRRKMAKQIAADDQMMHGAEGEQFKSMGLHPVRDESHNIKTPVGRIMHAGVTSMGRVALAQHLAVMFNGERIGTATMEMSQADIEARLDIMDMGIELNSVLVVDTPPAMGKTTFVNKRLLERPAMAPESNRAERRAGRHNKPKQKLKGLR